MKRYLCYFFKDKQTTHRPRDKAANTKFEGAQWYYLWLKGGDAVGLGENDLLLSQTNVCLNVITVEVVANRTDFNRTHITSTFVLTLRVTWKLFSGNDSNGLGFF